MKNLAPYFLTSALFSLVLAGCNGESVIADNLQKPSDSLVEAVVESDEDLVNCTEKRTGQLYQVQDDGYRLCFESDWVYVDYVAETEEDIPNCTAKREGQTGYVLETGLLSKCEGSSWSEEETVTPASSAQKQSKSSSSKKSSGDDPDDDDDVENPGDGDLDDDDNPSVDGTSSSSKPVAARGLMATMYDSDYKVNPLFTEYMMGAVDICAGVFPGIVEEYLGADKKPVYSGTANAEGCVGSSEKFNTLFNYTANVNEISHYDMPLELNDDGEYVFTTEKKSVSVIDSIVYPDGTVYREYSYASNGGFFPLENKASADIDLDLSPVECPLCRTTRLSEATPLMNDTVETFYCNGPAWNNGLNCDGLFDDGESPSIWNWSAERWSEPRNHHFCMEINSSFTYKKGQYAAFTSGGDLWVFVNGKLAVDLGGNHLPAPGYISMDLFAESGDLVSGSVYDMDIFFCARKTSISDFSIKTNIKLRQN